MRLFWIGIPAGLALASGGALLYYLGAKPHVESVDLYAGKPKHPVTAEMAKETGAKTEKLAPGFELKDVDGKKVTIASPGGERPQFVYFVLDGCPCSFEAEPLFHDLAERFKGKVDFVSITDAGIEKAKKWNVQMLVPYPVVSDPKLDVIRAYGAKNSVYSALLSKDGKIIKMWPGYSISILQEMNKKMAELSGEKEQPFNTKYAPKEAASGCAFALG